MSKRISSKQTLLSQLKGMIIFSRRDARPLGIIDGAIFRRENLQLAFFRCMTAGETQYVRADQTAILDNLLTVQSMECFGDKDDFIRERMTFQEDCQIINYKVCDVNGKKLGTVEDCSIKLPAIFIDRLHVRRPLLKSLQQSSLIVPVSAILDITPEKNLIVIQSEARDTKKIKKAAAKPAIA